MKDFKFEEIEMEYFDERDFSKNSLDNALVVMSNAIARKQTKWSARETKLFLSALSQIKWRNAEDWVTLSKKDIIKKLGMDTRDSNKLRNIFKEVAKKSWVEFNGINEDEWQDGFLIVGAKSTRNNVSVHFNKTYLPLLDKLESHFTKYHLDNIAHFKSKHAIILFQNLKSWYNPTTVFTHKKYSLQELKSLFELKEDAYMVKRVNKKTGKENITFDVYTFEKKVLKKAQEEINSNPVLSGMHIDEIRKLKTNGEKGYVTGYEFIYSLVNEDGSRYYPTLDNPR